MTTTTRLSGLGLTLLLAACGGGSDAPRENTAAGSAFTYAAPQAATAEQAGSMGATVASLDAFKASPGASAGLGASDAGSVTGSLLTGGSFASFSPAEIGGTSAAVFDVPACAVVTTGKVVFNGCRVTVSETAGTSTTAGTLTVDGQVAVAADGQTLDWDLAYGVSLTMGGDVAMRMVADLRAHGHVVVTETTAVGSAGSEVTMRVTIDGQSLSAAVDESLTFDLTHAATCASGVTGGTLEAKRVWVERPSQAPVSATPDQALKVTWTGCGEATAQIGSR